MSQLLRSRSQRVQYRLDNDAQVMLRLKLHRFECSPYYLTEMFYKGVICL